MKKCNIIVLLASFSLIMPGNVSFAEEVAENQISVFVATDRHDAGDGTGNNLQSVLQSIVDDEESVLPTVTILGGDNVGEGPAENDYEHDTAEIDAEIYEVLGENVTTYYTYGSHDQRATSYDDFLTGPVQENGYYIYGISYSQMLYATDAQAEADEYDYLDSQNDINGISAQDAVEKFTDWVNSLNDHLPILVMSHVPMHYNREDNFGGALWANALNQAASEHDIFAFWGHNHTMEEKFDNYVDRDYYLTLPGDILQVQGEETAEEITAEFTYMNAGYLKLGFGTLLTFTDNDNDYDYDEVVIQRYTTEGKQLENFGNTDYPCPYTFELREW